MTEEFPYQPPYPMGGTDPDPEPDPKPLGCKKLAECPYCGGNRAMGNYKHRKNFHKCPDCHKIFIDRVTIW